MFRRETDSERAVPRPRHDVEPPRAMQRMFGAPNADSERFSVSSPRLPSRKRDGAFPGIVHAACPDARAARRGGQGLRDLSAGDHPEAAAMSSAAKPATNPAPMTRAQIRAELAKVLRVLRVSDLDRLDDYIESGSVATAALWEPLVEWPAFGELELRIGPDDLRAVTTVSELVSVIDRALQHAAQ